MPARVELIRPERYRTTPWRNGGGVTHEILAGPDDASLERGFDWRLSIAEVVAPGPFSAFDGCDRTLTLLDGHLTLVLAARRVPLVRRVPFAFDGGAVCSAELPAGPARDLNAITRRGRATHSVSVVPAGADAGRLVGAPLVAALALDAPAGVEVDGTHHDLPQGATLRIAAADHVRVLSQGAVALVAFTPRG